MRDEHDGDRRRESTPGGLFVPRSLVDRLQTGEAEEVGEDPDRRKIAVQLLGRPDHEVPARFPDVGGQEPFDTEPVRRRRDRGRAIDLDDGVSTDPGGELGRQGMRAAELGVARDAENAPGLLDQLIESLRGLDG